MRIAVFLHGLPRHLEESAWWFKNRVFPNNDQFTVDYFCYFWDTGDPDLETRINDTYNPVKYGIGDYNLSFHAHRHAVRMANKTETWENIPPLIESVVCYKPDEFNSFHYNFPGMFLSAAEGIRHIGEETLKSYDIVIRTRSDICIEPIDVNMLENIFRHIEEDTINCPWVDIKNGQVFVGDLAFFGKPDTIWKYFSELDSNLIKMATVDKRIFSEFNILNGIDLPVGHVIWSKASIYTKVHWKRLFWNSNMRHGLKTSLFRHSYPIEELRNMTYFDIERIYIEEEKIRHGL